MNDFKPIIDYFIKNMVNPLYANTRTCDYSRMLNKDEV